MLGNVLTSEKEDRPMRINWFLYIIGWYKWKWEWAAAMSAEERLRIRALNQKEKEV